MFRSLLYRNYRLFFTGQCISLVGTWVQQIAMGWLVYRITNSVFLLGVVAFASQIPSFVLTPIAGVLADRWDRRRILVVTQSLSALQALILAGLTLTGNIAVWHIIVLGIFLGCLNSVDIPARHSFIIDMIETKATLGNAIALNSFMFNAARIIGPSIAGILISLFGEGICFLLNGISFIPVVASLYLMKINAPGISTDGSNVLHRLKEGITYTFGFFPIRAILLLVGAISLMGSSYVVLMPVFAKNILGGGPQTLGFLMASVGLGAIVGTMFLASKKRALRFGMITPVSASIFAVSLIAFSLSRALWLSLVILLVTGFGFMVHMASSNTMLQTIVDDDKRGRVMSFYAMAFMGMAPVGSLLGGTLASIFGATQAVIIGSVFCIAASLAFAGKVSVLKKMVDPIYDKLEALPGAIAGIENVSELAVPPED